MLLNPFHVPGSHVEKRLKLVIDVTGAQWAKEHLACTLPKVAEIKAYAKDRGLEYSAKPNGTLTTSLAFVFIDHFAARGGLIEEWEKINAFFNERYGPILDSADYPNAYLIYLGRQEGAA
ncbi:MAG TPA: hypothetical protein VFA48_03470 [Gammaproteobacteria bacterium]|nr:hypothetical protein [Gammaproteobacteria bacterium]